MDEKQLNLFKDEESNAGATGDTVALLLELETLKQQVAKYETEMLPLANAQLTHLREQAVKSYNLNEDEAKVMAERLAGLNNPQAINETALTVAGQLRATNKSQGVDPTWQGGGFKSVPKPADPAKQGAEAYHSALNSRYGQATAHSRNGTARVSVSFNDTPRSNARSRELTVGTRTATRGTKESIMQRIKSKFNW